MNIVERAMVQRMPRVWILPCLILSAVRFGWAADPVEPVTESATVDPFDPDAGQEAEMSSSGAVAGGQDPDCNVFGAFISPFQGSLQYRGNIYRFTQRALLEEIKMELSFTQGAMTDFYVAIHQRQPDGTYHRFAPDVIISNAQGLGTTDIYTTGTLTTPVEIDPGFDYAIGFAWGSRTVTYGRDVQGYPIAFEAGQVLGLAAASGLQPPPNLVPETFQGFQIFTGGAYSMQLCFEPEPGACCRYAPPQGSCFEMLETDCAESGGFFYGERSRCSETPCQFGSCCGGCGTCNSAFTPEQCQAADGARHWAGIISCPASPLDLCPVITGACCNGTTCSVRCQSDCAAAGGTYLGDDTDCDPNMCRGACCVPGGCLNRTVAGCAGIQGSTFKELGTSCLTLRPENECGGACCRGLDIGTNLQVCEPVGSRTLCTPDPEGFPASAYRGDGTTCGGSCTGVTYRACCLPDGTCINATQSVCTAAWIAGHWDVNGNCDANPTLCLASLGRCCFSDGSCQQMTTEGCSALGGQFGGTASLCSPTICTPTAIVGACCGTAPGDCTVRTESQCAAIEGNYRGNGTNCNSPVATCPGFGGCCRAEGECVPHVTSAQCGIYNGDYLGNSASCPDPTVCAETKACCTVMGACLELLPQECDGIGGVSHADTPDCRGDTCPSGACCINGSCEIRTEFGCRGPNTTYSGNFTTCLVGIRAYEPPNCAIDARQPHDPNNPNPTFSWNEMRLTLPCTLAEVGPLDFTVFVSPTTNLPPTIAEVRPGTQQATLVFSRRLLPPEWICVTHNATLTKACMGALPADVSSNGLSSSADIQTLLNPLNGFSSPLPTHRCDLDRSGQCNGADLLMAVDLLNGGDTFALWANRTLPACPSTGQ